VIARKASAGAFLIALGDQDAAQGRRRRAPRADIEEVERVTFPDGGGPFDLGLAIPRLPDMDDVVVDEASLSIRALPYPIDVDSPRLERRVDGSTIVDLGAPSRLVSIDVTIDGTLTGSQRVLLSSAEPGAQEAPMFAADPFSGTGLYPAPLTGMALSAKSGAARLTFLQPVAGRRWAVRVVEGESAGDLTAGPGPSLTVTGVRVDGSPTDVRVTIPGDGGADASILYAGSGVLLPAAEPQAVVFTPLAQRHLRARLAAAASSDDVMLSVPLRLASTSEGVIGIVSRSLRSHYLVNLQRAPIELALGGEWAELPLVAPAGRRPRSGAGTLEARLAGRELDPAWPPPPQLVPATGVTVAPRRRVAALAVASPGVSGLASVVAVRLLLGADQSAELVLEVCGDAAGLPATTLGTVVRRIPATAPTWHEFVLTAPLDVPSPGRVWCVLHTNDQPVRWFTGHDGAAPLGSSDDGATWGSPSMPLGFGGAPLVQLFRTDPGESSPRVDVYLGGQRIDGVELTRLGAQEAAATLTLPEAVLAALGGSAGDGRVTTPLRLFSRTVMRLTVRDLACTYDPTA
jgi:hypothetical protein